MKTEQFLKSLLPEFQDGDTVNAVMDHGKPVYCEPTPHENVMCPMCWSHGGYRVRNGGECWWACLNDSCIEINGNSKPDLRNNFDATTMMRNIGAPERMCSASFSEWKHSEGIKKIFLEYSKNCSSSMLISGTNGSGKTYSAVALMREFFCITHDIPGFYNVSDLYQKWLLEMPNASELIYRLLRVPLLVIDDLGTRLPTDAFNDFLYLIINNRYAAMKGTIVTTNLAISDIEEKFGKPISSRLLNGKFVVMDAQDMRVQKPTLEHNWHKMF
jgi:DNA replication protein DnaC